jgi:hypothetical protein
MAKTIDPEGLRHKIAPLVEEILAKCPPERLFSELVELGANCYHAGRVAERQYWGRRFAEMSEEAKIPVFEEPEKIVAD